MKRRKKKELLEIIDTLENANKRFTKKSNLRHLNVVDFLSQCQEAALDLGNYLESLGEGTETLVRILEDYCENIFQLSVAFSDDGECKKNCKKIQKQLVQLNNGIRHELPAEKKEIVFLPYKASMWDSLETIWRAANEDENCDAYVVPIPYYDKNPDGTYGQVHYEGEEYPKDVPITSWQSYNITERQPDVIYIHNPYDDWNSVTSVHPDFYSNELKKHTDMLVYIPYFVCAKNTVAKHLCVLPGILYADKVIVQSEEVRRIYIEELHKFELDNNCKNAFGKIEEKILALGSPKYDKVRVTSKAELDVPEKWRIIATKPEGTLKKIVLYNTSIQSLLSQKEKAILKIEHVLKTFEKIQKDVVLLWRPHPLIPATIQSMEPSLWKQYEKIISKYCEESWGIYDDSSDTTRAILWSDAYYGDGGSILELYSQTGKPLMIQNVQIV